MSDSRSEPDSPAPRALVSDRVLIGFGLVAIGGLAVVLWSQAGRDVFASAMAGLWALCF